MRRIVRLLVLTTSLNGAEQKFAGADQNAPARPLYFRGLQQLPAGGSMAEPAERQSATQARFIVNPAFASKSDQPFDLHIARLGFSLATDVLAGENSGRKLQHDFVGLAMESAR